MRPGGVTERGGSSKRQWGYMEHHGWELKPSAE